jgi:hypothetical protein
VKTFQYVDTKDSNALNELMDGRVKGKPEKQAKQIDGIVAKIGAKWDKILAGQGE